MDLLEVAILQLVYIRFALEKIFTSILKLGKIRKTDELMVSMYPYAQQNII